MIRIQIITVVALILAALIFGYSQSQQLTTRQTQTATQAQAGRVVKRKKIVVKKLPVEVKGLELKRPAQTQAGLQV